MGEISRKHIPMLRYALCLLIGIGLTQYIPAALSLYAGCIAGAGLLYICIQFFKPSRHYKTYLQVCIVLVCICAGMIRQACWKSSTSPVVKQLRITSFPQKNSFQIQFEASVLNTPAFQFFDAETFLIVCTDTGAAIAYGDVFTTAAPASLIEERQLPYEFDYKAYLFGNGIRRKIELCAIHTESDHTRARHLYAWIRQSRKQFKKATSLIFTTAESKGLAESLLLGYREELDKNTKDAFLKSGVSHLLAVSGMHTALLYQAVFVFFIPFGQSQKHRFIFLATALVILAYFTLLSGCSASVLRASLMCGMFAIAYAFRKRGSGLNTLGTSMVIMLWFSPYQAWNIGFQLSVLAVIGILTLHQYLSAHIQPQKKVYRYLVESVSITICAQITTLPVILYHFQSFPLYFIPANMLLIPISTVALFASMFSIFLVGLGIHANWIFRSTQWLIELFQQVAASISMLPNSSVAPISFSFWEAMIVLVVVGYYLVYPFKGNKKIMLLFTSLCLFWSGFRIYQEYRQEQTTRKLFISNGKRSLYLIQNGLMAQAYTQVPVKPADKAHLQAYFHITELSEVSLNEKAMGLTDRNTACTLGWVYRKNCSTFPQSPHILFSYKESDSIRYQAKNYHSLKVKRLVPIY
ncbi:ComEC/Rec2 family competence protein [Cytophaga hutchinsonii]|nr:ComEC/Rec2 family competence protein [Cytophaga hutchinsonii]SFX21770.1 competence protein ComEC [Cytophaga hutchinsonii ATCC 33406]